MANPDDYGVPPGAADAQQVCEEYLGIGTEDYRWYLTREPLDVRR